MLMSFLGPKKAKLLTFSGRQHFRRRNPTHLELGPSLLAARSPGKLELANKETAMNIKSPSSCYCRKPSPEEPVLSPHAVPLPPPHWLWVKQTKPAPSPRHILLLLAAPGWVHFRLSSSSWSSRSSRVGCIISRDEFGCPRRLPPPDSFLGVQGSDATL